MLKCTKTHVKMAQKTENVCENAFLRLLSADTNQTTNWLPVVDFVTDPRSGLAQAGQKAVDANAQLSGCNTENGIKDGEYPSKTEFSRQ